MIEYRQYVPPEKENDKQFVSRITVNVCMELSRQASETDDPNEFFVRALTNVSSRQSSKGGKWIHSYLDVPRKAKYLEPDFHEPNKVPVPFAKVHEPVDFTPAQLEEHLRQKRARNG